MKAITNIDTLKIQIDRDNRLQQLEVFNGLIDVIVNLDSMFIRFEDKLIGMGRIYRKHFVMYKGKKIASLTTGSYRVGSIKAKNISTVYFVTAEYFGLSRYHEVDKGSLACLLEVCSYLNNRAISLRITAIDICLDLIGAKPSEVLAIERLKRIKYHGITGHPTYKNITYIEVQANNMLSQA